MYLGRFSIRSCDVNCFGSAILTLLYFKFYCLILPQTPEAFRIYATLRTMLQSLSKPDGLFTFQGVPCH